MMKLNSFHFLLMAMSAMLLHTSCVNEEYDLNKEIDMEMTLLQNVSLPVGDIEKITLSEILSLEDDQDALISADASGDLALSFNGESISAEIDVPSFSIADQGLHPEPIIVKFGTGHFAGLEASSLTEPIVYSELVGHGISTAMDIEIDSELPEQIIDIESVTMNAGLSMDFSVNSGAVHMDKGFTIEFPGSMHIVAPADMDSRFELIDNHKLVLREPVSFSSDDHFEVALVIDRINVPEGSIVGRQLVIDEDIEVSGDFYLSPSDFTIIPDELEIDLIADISELEVAAAEVWLDLNQNIEGTEFELEGIPDFLTGDDVCLDIYNPELWISVDNGSPLSFDVKADILAWNGDDEPKSVSLGDDPQITIPALSSIDYVVSKKGSSSDNEVSEIILPEISSLISRIPEKIAVDNIFISSSDNDPVSIGSGESYSAAIDYKLYAPLAFGPELNIDFTYDVENLGLVLDAEVRKAEFALTLVNSIPLGFALTASGIDSEGNVLEGVALSVDKPVSAGTHTSPVSSEIVISLTNDNETLELDGLRLSLKANAPEGEYIGTALNTNQGLEIKNLVLTLPEGITLSTVENE